MKTAALLTVLLLSSLAFAGVFLPASFQNISEGRSGRFPIGVYWADVRVYQVELSTVFASCSGTGSARVCGPCPRPNESAKFIVTFWNGTAFETPSINEGGEYVQNATFRIKAKMINETSYVENTANGQCAHLDPYVTVEFSPYVQCSADSDCPSGYGCAASVYECVSSQCSTNADCADDEYCTEHKCYTVPLRECGEVRNHTWVPYDCCDDSACGSGERCVHNTCRVYRYCMFDSDCFADEACGMETRRCEALEAGSECGAFVDHAWTDFECCASSDCPDGMKCHDNVCLECASDYDCPGDSFCKDSECVQITGCGLIANHTIVQYECCENSDCFEEFACVENRCRPIPCPCGEIVDHVCIPCETPTPEPTPGPDESPTATPSPTAQETPTPVPASPCGAGFALLAAGLLVAVKKG